MLILTREFLNLWLTLLLIWLIANASLEPPVLATGAVAAGLLAYVFSSFGNTWRYIRWTPRVLFHYLLYLGVFLYELAKANLNVALLVLAPRVEIQPGIIEIKTRLRSPLGRLALANSITLTPGTLVVDVRGDSLFVHVINVTSRDLAEATRQVSGRFERHLEVIFG